MCGTIVETLDFSSKKTKCTVTIYILVVDVKGSSRGLRERAIICFPF